MIKDTNSSLNNILLTNLIKIRWIAITGQVLAIILVYFYFNISIPIISCLIIVFVSGLVNIFSFFTKKINNYLTDKEAFYFLLFDTLQLGILLYLTGGIYNPFTLLLIAPLIISASFLPLVYSFFLSSLSTLIVILLSDYYVPIFWNNNFIVPKLFTYGLVLSLIVSFIFLTIYVYLFANSSRDISKALSKTRSILANHKKISEVGSLSAAAVHELSTPLNTIFLILNDLKNDNELSKNKQIIKDIDLLHSQAERCKDILFNLSKNPQDLKDNFLNKIKLSDLVKLNFEKFNNKKITLEIKKNDINEEPILIYKDEIMYAFGNIMQNSIQHAVNTIQTNIFWDTKNINVTIEDDGEGFSKEILDKIGNPYISKNKKGMGLGIFIAKNLIENIDGSIKFKNNSYNKAVVEISIKL